MKADASSAIPGGASEADDGGKLKFFVEHTQLADARAFMAWLAPLRKPEWVGRVWLRRANSCSRCQCQQLLAAWRKRRSNKREST